MGHPVSLGSAARRRLSIRKASYDDRSFGPRLYFLRSWSTRYTTANPFLSRGRNRCWVIRNLQFDEAWGMKVMPQVGRNRNDSVCRKVAAQFEDLL